VFRAIFAAPDLTTFGGLGELDRELVGQRFESDRAVIECRVADPEPWCRSGNGLVGKGKIG
jgi:hypothetical protein